MAGLENRLDEAVKSNERIQKENELFESYFRRHSQGMEVLEEDVKTPKHKKRGKDRHKVPVLLTTEQKVTVASSEADEVQKEIKETKKNSEKLIDTLRVRLTVVCVCWGALLLGRVRLLCFWGASRVPHRCYVCVLYSLARVRARLCVRRVGWRRTVRRTVQCSAVARGVRRLGEMVCGCTVQRARTHCGTNKRPHRTCFAPRLRGRSWLPGL